MADIVYRYRKKEKRAHCVFVTYWKGKRGSQRYKTNKTWRKYHGVEIILSKLYLSFLKDRNTRDYVAFKELQEYKRISGENFANFIIRFQQLYSKLVKYDMALPEAVQGALKVIQLVI